MRIITEDNIDQLVSMSYSNNINTLLKDDTENIETLFANYNKQLSSVLNQPVTRERIATPTPVSEPEFEESPAYVPSPRELPSNDSDENVYNPNSPEEEYKPYSPETPPLPLTPSSPDEPPPIGGIAIKNHDVKRQFDSLPEREKLTLMKIVAEKAAKDGKEKEEEDDEKPNFIMKKSQPPEQSFNEATSILKIPEEKKEGEGEGDGERKETSGENINNGETRSVTLNIDSNSASSTNNETKQIKITK